ncbi:hypothetical protein AAG906_003497 [Vitis piasezkii]
MLEDNVRTATQQILVTGQWAKNDVIRNPKATSQRKQPSRGQAFVAPKFMINYIHGGLLDEEYRSKRKTQRLLRATSVREQVSSIRPGLTSKSAHQIDGIITFFPMYPNRILQPHRDALILTLGIKFNGASTISWRHRAILGGKGSIPFNAILDSLAYSGEIYKLLASRFIKEVEYPYWLANMVVVPKKWGKCFLLPQIYQIMDSTTEHGIFSFLDAFFGYHQIPMSPADEEKIAFITPRGLYCNKVMSFGLKNARATYQRLMTKIFKPLIKHTVEVYIGDIVVKRKTKDEHNQYLEEVFRLLKKGIEVNPDQIKVVMETSTPSSKKELQRLTGRLVALGRFIANGRKTVDAFEGIKHYLTQPPILSSPQPNEQLYMYLAVSDWAVSAVLFRCILDKEQRSIYYINKAMADVEIRYLKMEQMALALRSTTQKLRLFFQVHLIVVLTNQPLRSILHKPDLLGRMLKWAIELRSGVDLLLRSSIEEQLEQAIQLEFSTSNNETEYEAIMSGLNLALALSASKFEIYSDSQLVIGHIQGKYEAKDERMSQYLTKPTFSIADTPICNANEESTEWTHEIGNYLWTGYLPEDSKHAHKVRVQATRFTLIEDCLYRRSFEGPYLRCLDSTEAQYVLAELHEGVCGNHVEGRSLAHCAHSQGYYWPTMKQDAKAYVRKCDKCQRHAPIPRMASEVLNPITSPLAFA